ncbi:MAG: methylenetetrahydrofolate reductase [Acidimicrobiales bacterium]
MLIDRIRARETGIVLYGMVPPKTTTDTDELAAIAARQRGRIADLPINGLVVYDLQDEQARTSEARPFPFIETVDGFDYSRTHLGDLDVARVIYRAVGKYTPDELRAFLDAADPARELTVFVGAASRDQAVTMSIDQAYALRSEVADPPPLGGVVIPERHQAKGTEHLRVFDKIEKGCEFLVSQGVYDVEASKNFLSDYYYEGQRRGVELVPILFTLTPCGSAKTLDFMKWLGISIPRWLENELTHTDDILEQSVDISERNYRELQSFAAAKGIPIGCNVESVAVRKVEVEASVALLHRLVS